jgi:subtilase family serine protease
MKKLLTTSLIISSVALVIVALAAPSPRSTLKGSKPSWAKPGNLVSAAHASDQLGFRVYLGWNNASGAEALARAVSDPKNKSYRHYLTPAQFRQQFAPTANQVAQVQSWLTSQGFTLVYTPKNNHYVSAKGTVAQAQAAFGAAFGMYKVNGLTLRSPSADVTIPSSLAGIVDAVVGLDQSAFFVHPNNMKDGPNAPPSPGFRNACPLSAYYAEILTGATPLSCQPPAAPGYSFPTGFTDNPLGLASVPWTIKGHTPADVKGAYNISSSYDGTGQTVAVIDAYASPTILQDANQWSANRGIPQFGTARGGTLTQVVAPGTYNVPENPKQDPQGWYGEETLDVESVHGMAPNANVVFVGSPNNYQDLDAAMVHVVEEHLAQIVSNSYGFPTEFLPPGYILPFEDTLIQAIAEGIGVYFSSGDSGDETVNFGFATTDYPASSPHVTSVGGTSLAVDASHNLVFETGWGVSSFNCNPSTLVCNRAAWQAGAGGGVSCVFPQPDYQSGAGVPAAGAGTLCEGFVGRGVPDIAALADAQTGYLVGQTQTFPNTCTGGTICSGHDQCGNVASTPGAYYDEYRLGGTSLSSPIVAGIMALSDQKAGAPHGFANPFFYQNPGKFRDILAVNTAVARRNYNNSVDDCNGTVDRLRTFNDYSGSPTQFTGTGWDNVTGLGVFNGIP